MNSTTQQGMGFENMYRTAVGFEIISRTVDIDNKYRQYYTAIEYRFRERRTAVAFENIYRAVDFENIDFENIGST